MRCMESRIDKKVGIAKDNKLLFIHYYCIVRVPIKLAFVTRPLYSKVVYLALVRKYAITCWRTRILRLERLKNHWEFLAWSVASQLRLALRRSALCRVRYSSCGRGSEKSGFELESPISCYNYTVWSVPLYWKYVMCLHQPVYCRVSRNEATENPSIIRRCSDSYTK